MNDIELKPVRMSVTSTWSLVGNSSPLVDILKEYAAEHGAMTNAQQAETVGLDSTMQLATLQVIDGKEVWVLK